MKILLIWLKSPSQKYTLKPYIKVNRGYTSIHANSVHSVSEGVSVSWGNFPFIVLFYKALPLSVSINLQLAHVSRRPTIQSKDFPGSKMFALVRLVNI